jgi:hypothetical protein
MQESMIEATSQIEQLKIENTALKKGTELQSAANDLNVRGMEIQGKATEHAMKTDYQGKLQMKDQQMAQKEMGLAGKELALKSKEQQMNGDMQEMSLQQMLKDHLAQIDQKLLAAKQAEVEEDAAENEAASEEDDVNKEAMQLLMALTESQKKLQDEITKLTKVVAADRETEVVLGADGKKRGRSRVVYQ